MCWDWSLASSVALLLVTQSARELSPRVRAGYRRPGGQCSPRKLARFCRSFFSPDPGCRVALEGRFESLPQPVGGALGRSSHGLDRDGGGQDPGKLRWRIAPVSISPTLSFICGGRTCGDFEFLWPIPLPAIPLQLRWCFHKNHSEPQTFQDMK